MPRPKLGVLGNFILMLISHIYDIRPFTINNTHYFQILARFASLGPEAREFLLRAKIVGRFMDFFFDSASPYRQLFGDMNDLGPVHITEQPEMGLPTDLDKKMRTYFQQMIEKRRRQNLANATPKYKYLIEVVSLCVRHIKAPNTQQSPFALDAQYKDAITTFYQAQESDIFNPEAKFLKKFIVEARSNRSIGMMTSLHCHHAFHDNEGPEELFKTVEAGLNDYDFDQVRPFLCMLQRMLEIQHKEFKSKRSHFLQKFLEIVHHNQAFFKWMEVVIEFIFKIVGRIQAVREWFYKNPKQWSFLVEWINNHTRPPHPSQN